MSGTHLRQALYPPPASVTSFGVGLQGRFWTEVTGSSHVRGEVPSDACHAASNIWPALGPLGQNGHNRLPRAQAGPEMPPNAPFGGPSQRAACGTQWGKVPRVRYPIRQCRALFWSIPTGDSLWAHLVRIAAARPCPWGVRGPKFVGVTVFHGKIDVAIGGTHRSRGPVVCVVGTDSCILTLRLTCFLVACVCTRRMSPTGTPNGQAEPSALKCWQTERVHRLGDTLPSTIPRTPLLIPTPIFLSRLPHNPHCASAWPLCTHVDASHASCMPPTRAPASTPTPCILPIPIPTPFPLARSLAREVLLVLVLIVLCFMPKRMYAPYVHSLAHPAPKQLSGSSCFVSHSNQHWTLLDSGPLGVISVPWECRARGARMEIVLLQVERRVRGGEGRSKPTTG